MWRRLDARITAVFIAVLLVVQLAGFSVIRYAIDRNALGFLNEELDNGQRLFLRLLSLRGQRMTDSARVLAADFGFREALATGDRETVTDALANHGARIGASHLLMLSPQRTLVGATTEVSPALLQAVGRAAREDGTQGEARVVTIGGRPHWLVTVPVKAPVLIGWLAMAFALDRTLLDDLHQLSGIAGAILVRDPAGAWQLHAARLEASSSAYAPLLGDDLTRRATLSGVSYLARPVTLGPPGGGEVRAVLMRSIDAALEPFHELQLRLLLITIVGAALSAAASWIGARRVTGPLKALTRSAERLAHGDYDTRVDVGGRDEVGELARGFETMRQGLRERDQRISRLAYWDRLTGLPNREQFGDQLQAEVARAHEARSPLVVLMLDLDRFKQVNDVLGPAFGDRLLAEMARRLREHAVRQTDLVARIGGDEFAVLLPGTTATQAREIAHRLIAVLDKPITLDEQTVDLRAGIGAAVFPDDGTDADALMRRVEVAMYAAKTRQAGLLFYDATMDNRSDQSLSLLSELREAVRSDQLELHLQPKVALADGCVIGAEALVRWRHPERGMVPPMQFIPFAEQTGAIREITQWMIERSAAMLAQLDTAGHELKLAVNLSTRDLMDQQLPAKVARVLERHRLPAQRLCLEITESAIMDDPQRAEQTLKGLHELGVALSIDDFGTGYSSLAYLKRLPVNQLKIDRSFVMNMERDAADVKIVRSTVDLAHNLGLRVVAEGVETAAAWRLLRELGCDEGQGYLIARPMPATDFTGWLAAWRPPDELVGSRTLARVG